MTWGWRPPGASPSVLGSDRPAKAALSSGGDTVAGGAFAVEVDHLPAAEIEALGQLVESFYLAGPASDLGGAGGEGDGGE